VHAARGLVLVTGPTGSGKSTTLAGMVHPCNDNPDHIITIEDPIEFVHESRRCLVNQREVHRDTLGFSEALRSALREDPDVILVGEMRDLETIPPGAHRAETGDWCSHAAHQLRRQDHRPYRRRVPGRGEGHGALDAVGVAARGGSQTADEEEHRWPVAAPRDHDRTPAIRNLIREGKIAQMYSHSDWRRAGHADPRPVPRELVAKASSARKRRVQGEEQDSL